MEEETRDAVALAPARIGIDGDDGRTELDVEWKNDDGIAGKDDVCGNDATLVGSETSAIVSSRRMLVEVCDDGNSRASSARVGESSAKKRRVGTRDDVDHNDVDCGTGDNYDEGAITRGDAGDGREKNNRRGDHPRADDAPVVVRLPPASHVVVTSAKSRALFELMRLCPSKNRIIVLDCGNASHLSTITHDDVVVLTTIEAVKTVLEGCDTESESSIDVDSILRAFEGGMIEVVLKTTTSDISRDVGIDIVSVRLDLAPYLDMSHTIPPVTSESMRRDRSHKLLVTLGEMLRGSIFDDVARSLSNVGDRRHRVVDRRADDSHIITAKMVYGVIDNVHYSGEDDDEDLIRTTHEKTSRSRLDIPGLVPTLRPYQVAAVRWMLRRESKVDDDDDDASDVWELCWFVLVERPHVASSTSFVRCNMMPLPEWKYIKSWPDERRVFCNPFTGWLVGSYEEAKYMMLGTDGNGRVMGGILAESMGLGKTVEVIACILANASPLSSQAVATPATQSESDPDADSSNESLYSTSSRAMPSHREEIYSNGNTAKSSALNDTICVCGRSISSFVGGLSWVVCEACSMGMHGRCAGFESEEDLAFKTKINIATGVRVCPVGHCVICVAAEISQNDGASVIESRATLIVTPPAILVQWQKEINRHTRDPISGRPLKVVVYPGVRELCRAANKTPHEDFHLVNPRQLANADVVLLSFQTLISELGHSDENPFAGFANKQSYLRNRKRYTVLPSPLTSVKWWRICLDEAQRVEVPTAASAKMARKLITDKKWCVSGTPIGRGKLDDLYGLLLFLSMKPFDEKSWFSLSFNLSHGNALSRLSHLLKDVMWRSTKENKFVRRQMGIPDQEEKRVILKFSSVEQFFYDRQYDVTSNAVCSWTEAKGPNWLSHSLQKLRAACCHPQVGTSGIGGRVRSQHRTNSSTVLSMDEILEKLIDDAKAKCEEAQRIVILHTIGLASLTNLNGKSESSRQIYQSALDIADSNALPAEVFGEAVLNGSRGFCSDQKTINNGAVTLGWQISDESLHEVWADINFRGAPRKISTLKLRHILRSELHEGNTESCTILKPKECILQMSTVFAGGSFVNVHSFTLKDTEDEVQLVNGFITKKSKCWRIRIISYHGMHPKELSFCDQSVTPELQSHCFHVGIIVKLFEPEIADDHLQRLHIIHNMSILSSIDETAIRRLNAMKSDERVIINNYMAHAKAIHRQSKQHFLSAVKVREKFEKEIMLSEGSNLPWHEDILDWVNRYGTDQDRQNLCETVKYALTNFMDTRSIDDRSGILIRKGIFPNFISVDELRAALSVRIQQGENEVGLRQGLNKKKDILETVMKLSSSPSDEEIYKNSHCRRCRRDWEQRGPICSHCHLEENLVKLQCLANDPEITCVLKSLSKFVKDHIARAGGERGHYGEIIGERASKFLLLQNKIRDEILAAKSVWKAHFDLLSDIDELNQCKRAMRLRQDGEDVSALTKTEAAFIIDPHNLPVQILEHEVKQAAALGVLRKNKSTLKYLKNQRQGDAKYQTIEINSGDPSTATAAAATADTCCICLAAFGNERSVLPCGHSFHTFCVDRLFKKFGSSFIQCPMRCETIVRRVDVFHASKKNSEDRGKMSREIQGDWGTKVNRLINDVIDAVQVGDKGVIFSQWDEMMNIVAEALGANGISFVRPRSGKQFGEDIKRFQSSDCSVVLMNIKNGAEGLTLTEANHVFMLEPILSYGLDAQAISRIHRIGQLRKTYVHRYIVQNTIEEIIDAIRIEREEALVEDGLKDKQKHLIKGGGIDGGFDASELRRLFGKVD